MIRKIILHSIFWVFIFLYTFDYHVDEFSLRLSLTYSFFEVFTNGIEFYVNLLFLLPIVLQRNGIVTYSLCLLLLLTSTYLLYAITGTDNVVLSAETDRSILSFLLNHLLFILLSIFVWYFYKFEQEKQKRLQLENQQLINEIGLLKAQINPHFLFNSLNNIYTLTLVKSDHAPKMIAALSDILRYSLDEGQKEKGSLDSEIKMIEKYLLIQEFRQIPKKDNVRFVVTGNTAHKEVPPLLLITLIENAFKHGDVLEHTNGFVQIKLNVNENIDKGTYELDFTINNSFQPNERWGGIGLANVRSQLALIYGNKHQLHVSEKNNVFTVQLNIYGN